MLKSLIIKTKHIQINHVERPNYSSPRNKHYQVRVPGDSRALGNIHWLVEDDCCWFQPCSYTCYTSSELAEIVQFMAGVESLWSKDA